MKKLLTYIVVLCTLLSFCFVGAVDASAATFNYDDWDIEGGIIYGYYGDKVSNLTIPSVDQYGEPIYKVGDGAFNYCDYLVNVTVSDGIAVIGNKVFKDCRNLRTVNLPDSLLVVGDSAFYNCDRLATINLPDSVLVICDSVFEDCDGLKTLDLPDSVLRIGGEAFKDCNYLESVDLPASLISFGWGNNFLNCTSLKSITIPGGISEIPVSCFSGCSNLEDIIFTPGGEEITICPYAFNGTNPRKVVFPDNVVAINSTSFYNLELTEKCTMIFCNPTVTLGGGEDNLGNVMGKTKNFIGVTWGYYDEFEVVYQDDSTAQDWFEIIHSSSYPFPTTTVKSASYFDNLSENKPSYGKPFKLSKNFWSDSIIKGDSFSEELGDYFTKDELRFLEPYLGSTASKPSSTSSSKGNTSSKKSSSTSSKTTLTSSSVSTESNQSSNPSSTVSSVENADEDSDIKTTDSDSILEIIDGILLRVGIAILIFCIVIGAVVFIIYQFKKEKRKARIAARREAELAAKNAAEIEVAEPFDAPLDDTIFDE